MKTWTSILLAGALAAFVGCNKSEPGGPGASSTHSSTIMDKIKGDPNTFTFSEKYTSVSLKQGEKQEMTIAINRGKDFKQAVKVKVDVPADAKGLKIDKPEGEIKASDTEMKIWVDAAMDATLGEHKIKITGTPATDGAATSYEQTVKISAK